MKALHGILVAWAIECVSFAAGKGHLERFGEHMPPASMVETLDVEQLRARAADGEVNALNPGFFLDEYVVRHRPVVFKGLARNWTFRQQVLDNDWLVKTVGADTSTRVETKDDDKHKVPPNVDFAQFIRDYETKNFYMVDETPPPMHKHIPMPEPLRCNKMSSKFFVTYFWMSTGETDSKMHIDTDENIMCVLHGTKRVLLVDPKYSEDVYADVSYSIGVSPINTKHVNHSQHPAAASVPYSLAIVEPGDCFFLPQNYWHYVHSFGKRNQAVTMWWKSKPLVAPERFNFTLANLSFAQTLSNYEDYVQAVAPVTPPQDGECAQDAVRSAAELGFGDGPEAVRRYLQEPESLHMSDFEFATDKEEGDFGEDSKGDRDEADWENPAQRALGLPESLAHCHFNLTNPRNPCFVPGCASRDDTFGCLRYTLEYCKRVADYGCQDLVWTLNKRSGEEYSIVTAKLPNVYEMDVEDWPALARNSDESGPQELEDVEEEMQARRERAKKALHRLESEGAFVDSGGEDALEISEWADLGLVEGEQGDEFEDLGEDDNDDSEDEATVESRKTGANIDSPLLHNDNLLPSGLTKQEQADHVAIIRWLAANNLLLQAPPSSLARQLHDQLQPRAAHSEL